MSNECRYCGYQGGFSIVPPTNGVHGNMIICANCRKFIAWERKKKNIYKRPGMKPGTAEEVWEQHGNCCAHCGASKEDLALLGVSLTVQHVPPYHKDNENFILVPYCNWCQQRSTSEINRIRALVERLRSKV